MKCKNFLKIFAASALLASHSISVHATLLWNQPPAAAPTILDREWNDPANIARSTYMVSDIVFTEDVRITSVATYFTNNNLGTDLAWPQTGIRNARLNIFDASLDSSDDPTVSTYYAAEYIGGALGIGVVVSGLSIDLAAGAYWIGLTPILPYVTSGGTVQFGDEYHLPATSFVGNSTQIRNPSGFFGYGSDWFDPSLIGYNNWDAAISIVGESFPDPTTVPEPTTIILLTVGLAGLGFTRRRMQV